MKLLKHLLRIHVHNKVKSQSSKRYYNEEVEKSNLGGWALRDLSQKGMTDVELIKLYTSLIRPLAE